ncbi:MAG: EscU/YscU/HrcU family type III secretion system export apparatus switch protein [Actinomycetota bacterium]|nr:EscU/YscU/HrcU family type III secretion system export apparatus switch protein [Actinomycetota bacterium]
MAGEKSEKPTAKRRKDARKQGQVARTPDLGAWSVVLLLGMAMPTAVGRELDALQQLLADCLRFGAHPTTPGVAMLLRRGAQHVFTTVLVVGVSVMVVAVAAALAQGGFFVSTKAVKPKLDKLNLLKGAKRIFGPQALWEGLKMLLKSSVVGLLVYSGIRAMMPLVGGMLPIPHVLGAISDASLSLLHNVALAGLVLAGADYAMARRRIGKQTRMTKEEVKQEYKQSEGDPMLKGAIRSRQLAMARNRMMADIPTADVVLVNPTHVAVALRYDPERGAPTVVARGAGAVAAAIRAKATEARVPLVRDVPLARSLYTATKVGQTIPPELFAAVATVLAFVISRRTQGQHGGEHRSPRPGDDLPTVLPAGRRRRNPSGAPAIGRP